MRGGVLAAAVAITLAGPSVASAQGAASGEAPASVPALRPALEAPVLIEADTMRYDLEAETVVAEGNVEVSSGPRLLIADTLTYNQKTQRLVAEGNVSLTDPDGNIVFADRIDIRDDLKDGVVRSLASVLAGRGRLAAAEARREDGRVSILERAVYSACNDCTQLGKAPLWQIKARRVVHDLETRELRYDDASIEVFGVPVVTIPEFSHSDPSVKRQSGFLAPSFGSSSILGFFAEIPYFFAPEPTWDLTVAPMITTRAASLLKGEYRRRTAGGRYELAGSLTYGEDADPGNPGSETGGHIFGEGRFKLSDSLRWGFTTALASDDTYLRRYEISSLDRLENTLFLEHFAGRSYGYLGGQYVQGLRDTDNQGLIPAALPILEYTYIPRQPVLGGTLALRGSLLGLSRGRGHDMFRASAGAAFERLFTTPGGSRIRAFAEARADGYAIEDRPAPGGDSTTGRAVALAGLEWRLPFVRAAGTSQQIIEPIAQLIVAPYGGNDADIPNEDSESIEFDESVLFQSQRFPGLDRWDSGPRADLGFRFAQFFPEGRRIEALVGQSFRLKENDAFPNRSGLDDTESDYGGRLVFDLGPELQMTNRIRLDQEDLSVRRAEVLLQSELSFGGLRASYLHLARDVGGIGFDKREELTMSGYVRVSEFWRLSAGFRRDLATDRMIESQAGFGYEDECTVFGVVVRRRFTRDRDLEPSTAILLRFALKTLTEGDSRREPDRLAPEFERD